MVEEYLDFPASPSLEPNYPNPFNTSTTIRYQLSADGSVRLDIFDLTGQRVRTLVCANQNPGSYEVTWDGTNGQSASVSTGIYLTKLQTDGITEVRKMMLIK